MSQQPTIVGVSPGVYVDMDQADLISIDPGEILENQDMERDNAMEARIYQTLSKQYIAAGFRCQLISTEPGSDDANNQDNGEG